MERGFIYCVTCLVNGKQYIGQTSKTIEHRWRTHLSEANRHDYKFYRAIRKYGSENFRIEEIMWVEAPTKNTLKKKLNFLEQHFIQKFETRKHGYNSTDGGDGVLGMKLSEETKLKLRNAQLGLKRPDWVCKKIGKSHLGKKLPKETCEKIRLSHLGNKNPLFGKPHSQSHREKISLSLRGNKNLLGKKFSKDTRRRMSMSKGYAEICQFTLDGKLVKVWINISEIKQKIKVNRDTLKNV